VSDFDLRALRSAFGAFTTGVTVVTSHDGDGAPIGFTANSFSSVSLDPPLLLVCIANSSSNFENMTKAKGFAVNILAETQVDVSNTFARPVEDRFASVTWQDGPHGAPVFEGVSAWFDCSMHQIVEAGDHAILIGRVEAFDSSATAGLGYARGAYVTPSTAAEALEPHMGLTVSALIEREGQVLLVEDGKGGLALPESTVKELGASETLQKLIASTGLTAEPGFVYSVFEDDAAKRQHIAFLCQTEEGAPTRGHFVPLTEEALASVTDSVMRTMLTRFAAENKLGNYGVYFGNQTSGKVRPISSERQA
jgi:flavin reductase (DIM6/NTAB) family NADH-FMN oxidoreductase RutF